MSQTNSKEIRLILGDQLNASHSWFTEVDTNILYVMMELRQETDYVRHHQQKILAFFAAMRGFAAALQKAGHRLLYIRLDDADNQQDLVANLDHVAQQQQCSRIALQYPDEYRLQQQLDDWLNDSDYQVSWYDSEHFFTARDALKDYFAEHKQLLMETFYRQLRRRTGYLMDKHHRPLGGDWNYDKKNRNKLPKTTSIPEPLCFANDVSDIAEMLDRMELDYFGEAEAKKLLWPVSRRQAKQLLNHFLNHGLADFGRYQDALTERGWSLFHSRLSFAMNCKMLSPRYVIEQALDYWQDHQEQVDIAQIEGFVRQILGWREFVRAVYWHYMPDYQQHNELQAKRALPDCYWTGNTQMNCLQQAIQQSLTYAYAHHIQRLMVCGNFALLCGIDPDAVDNWYLGVYVDAIEWVELPNTRGMSQFADGGIVGTKPYAASANYMHKMSDHCQDCHYQHDKTVGENACPLNSLYWHFIDRHQATLKDNPRMKMMYHQWQKRDPQEKKDIIEQAEQHLANINSL